MRQNYLDAMSKAAHSVVVVTTDGPAGKHGVTITAMCSVSVDGPAPALLVCIHHSSPVCDAILANRAFCVNMLREEQVLVSECFAGRSGAKNGAKFDCAGWKVLSTGSPVLEGSLAAFDCALSQHHRVGTHYVLLGDIRDVESGDDRKPLLYHSRTYARAETLEAP